MHPEKSVVDAAPEPPVTEPTVESTETPAAISGVSLNLLIALMVLVLPLQKKMLLQLMSLKLHQLLLKKVRKQLKKRKNPRLKRSA